MSWVLFFDGDCGFCSWSVRQVLRFDKHERISFAPLQGVLAREKDLGRYAAKTGGSMVLLRERDGKLFFRSDAWIELARVLGGGWRVFTLARIFPKWLRDRVYNLIANNRYRIAGRIKSCPLPDPALLKRLRP